MYEKNNKNYKILIRNLPFRMNLLKFKKLLSYYCKIRYIRIPRKKKQRNSRICLHRIRFFKRYEKSIYFNTKYSCTKKAFSLLYIKIIIFF
mmetsp:Transcript_5586/g.17842  ORF Transcript_5586/g.17842 Transcript_5586/m.17842 type:complete len:91 (-) Transcript_5586:6688-6960(-)